MLFNTSSLGLTKTFLSRKGFVLSWKSLKATQWHKLTMEIGFIGGFIILGAWIYEAYMSWKKGETPDIKFILAYVVGLSFLTYYTFQIKDMPLLFLNGAILSLTLLELDLAL